MLQGRRLWCIRVCLLASTFLQPLVTAQDKAGGEEADVYEPGCDVKAPKLIHYVEPQFSRDAKVAFVEGTVKISIVVTTDGLPTNCKVIHGLTEGEDRAALDAVQQWRFRAGTKDGKAVKVRVTAEVGFHLL